MKRIIVKISIVLLLVLAMAGRKETEVSAKIKTKKITIDLRGGNTAIREPEIVRKAKKVKVRSGKKSVVTVKFKKKRNRGGIRFLQNEKWQDEKNEVQGQSNKNKSTYRFGTKQKGIRDSEPVSESKRC